MAGEDLTDDEIRRFVEPIGLERLALNMAGTRRFAGAGLTSLAHSIIVGELLRGAPPVIRLGAYLHDAVDGLQGEIRKPFKTSQQVDMEERIWRVWMDCVGLGRVVKQLGIDCAGQIAHADRDAGDAEYMFFKDAHLSPPAHENHAHTQAAMTLVRHWAAQSAGLTLGYWLGTVQGLIRIVD